MLLALAIFASLMTCASAQQDEASQAVNNFMAEAIIVNPSIDEKKKSEGLLLEKPPSYINFTGQDGLKLEISLPSVGPFDYTLMFWFRSVKSYKELSFDESIQGGKKAYLFEIPSYANGKYDQSNDTHGVACYITNPGVGPILSCGSDELSIDLAKLPDIQAWMHLTFSSNYKSTSNNSNVPMESFVRIDISNESIEGRSGIHKEIDIAENSSRSMVFYGAGFGDPEAKPGFPGQYRQFWMTLGYLKDPESIKLLQHQYKVLDYSTMGYYKFETSVLYDRYADAFRNQTAVPINNAPIFQSENIAAPFCNSIPQKFEKVPQFYQSGGNKFKDIEMDRFDYKGRYIGYTMSFWLKNFGQHSFSETPIEGRQQHHMLKINECFAIWYDSPTSFRVYIYAKNDYEEVYSQSVFLPLFEWVNIQLTFSQQDGIVVMTFNQNGDKQQTVQNKVYLAEQYPLGKLHLFQSFVGIPYQLKIWQTKVELPINFDDSVLNEDLVVDYDFTQNNYRVDTSAAQPFQGWDSMIDKGVDIDAVEGEGFDFVYSNVPSGVKFNLNDAQKYLGQMQATATDWNDVTCPSPNNSQMFLGYKYQDGNLVSTSSTRLGAQFTTEILVDATDQYTVEFWYKADTSYAADLQEENKEAENGDKIVTYLFSMEDQDNNLAMDIYVENGVLKCAPFGLNQDTDDSQVLTYGEIDPLSTEEWQHISCIFTDQRFVKGQYLKVDMLIDGVIEDFPEKILRPQTFAKTVLGQENTNVNLAKQRRWTVVLGGDAQKSFVGSFKDMRLWKSARTDAELYSQRFNQIKDDDNLAGNLKFMDGSPFIYNAAEYDVGVKQFANEQPDMILAPSDLKNLVCASDTYFDPAEQKCTRYPYSEQGVSIVYYVQNNVQHGHNMILESIVQSPMFLPGKYQPETRVQWSMVDTEANLKSKAVIDKYFSGDRNEKTYYNFDPIFMGDFQQYNFQLNMNDEEEHNFFVQMRQKIIPRKCIQVVDSETLEPSNKFSKILQQDVTTEDDLEFEFQVQKIDGCSDEKENDLLETVVKVTSQPPLPQSIIEKIEQEQVSYDFNSESFKLKIPKDVQHDPKMIKNIPIQMIFTLFWQINSGDGGYSYMNVMYDITLASKIEIDYSVIEKENIIPRQGAPDNYVVQHQQNHDGDVVISVKNSAFAGQSAVGYPGLSFKWECANEGENIYALLNEYCQQWNGSPVLQISYKLFDQHESWIDKEIAIKVIASSIETSEIVDSKVQEMTKYFSWVRSIEANFDINTPNGCLVPISGTPDEFKCLILISVEQEITISPIEWQTTTPGYRYDYVIKNRDPEFANDDPVIDKKGEVSTTLTIPAETLDENSNYNLTVTVRNEIFDFIKPKTEPLIITTGKLPTISQFSVSPKEGDMFSTEFTITLSNYESQTENMTYVLWGIVNEGEDPLKISTSAQALNTVDGQTESKLKLPELTKLRAELTDENGEKVYIEESVDVKKIEGASWKDIVVQQIQEQQADSGNKAALWQRLQSIGQQANDAARASESPEDSTDAKETNIEISKQAFDDITLIPKNWSKQDSDADYDIVVNYIILTIGKISTYSEFLNKNVLQLQTETMEYILRIEEVILEINKDKEQRVNFANAVGNLMDQLSKQAHVAYLIDKNGTLDFPDIIWNRRLQDEETVETAETSESTAQTDLDTLRELMRKLVVVKNSYLDYLCNNDELIESSEGQKIEVSGQGIDFMVVRHKPLEQSDPDLEIISKLVREVTVSVPTDQVLRMSGDVDWVCYQATFSIANPVAGYPVDGQYYFENQSYIQLGTIDSTGRRLVDEKSVTDLQENPFKITFEQELTKEAQWRNGQTVCANYDGNDEKYDGKVWTTHNFQADKNTDCYTEYQEVEGKIICECSELYNYYYTIITDIGRTEIKPPEYQDETHTILLAIGIPLILLGMVMPVIMIFKDSADYQMIEDNFYEVDDLMISKLQYARNYLCKQEIYYREKEINQYRQLKELRSGSMEAFKMFNRTLHPYWSLFSHFDYRLKRLTRFSFILGQWSFITLLLWICYSKWFIDLGITEKIGDHRLFYVSIILSLFTIPLPRRFACIFTTEMYLLQIEENMNEDDEEKAGLKGAQRTEADEEMAQTSGRGEENRDAGSKEKEYDTRPALFDKWLQLKCISILFIFIFWVVAIVITYFLGVYSGSNKETSDIESFVELTVDEANEFVMCWYLAIFFWGPIINYIRIVIIALVAPIRAQTLFERQENVLAMTRDGQDGKDKDQFEKEWKKLHEKGMCHNASLMTCCLIPPESVELALDALYTIAIEKDGPVIYPKESEDQERIYAFDVMQEDRDKFSKAIADYKPKSKEIQSNQKGSAKKAIEMTTLGKKNNSASNRSNLAPQNNSQVINESKLSAKDKKAKKEKKKGKKGGKKNKKAKAAKQQE